MKIRRAHMANTDKVYIYENKKEEYHLIAIPDNHWSIRIGYDEPFEKVDERILQSLQKAADPEEASLLAGKIRQWRTEM